MDKVLTAEQIACVKGKGFLIDKRTGNTFNARVITVNGKVSAETMKIIASASEKFGSGEVAFTTRLTAEIQGVKFENIEPLIEYLGGYGLEVGGTGPKVRPIVSCKGTTCQYGLIDTYALSQKLHTIFYKGYRHLVLPHKFKIAVGGCPNNCVKPNLNDVGVIGMKIPTVDLEKCRGCKVCQVENACPIKHAKVVNGKILIDSSVCNSCGRCVQKCPFKAIENYTIAYRLYVGGTFGKTFNIATPISQIFYSEDEVIKAIENCLLYFHAFGIKGERFATTIKRTGIENLEKYLLTSELKDNL